jgi:hypothetical protein
MAANARAITTHAAIVTPPHLSESGTFLRPATVHVRSHRRHRQQVRTVMTLASVSTA